MYYCEECHSTFEEPQKYEEHHPYGDGFVNESFDVCPNCGSDFITEAKICDNCGEYISEMNSIGVCDDCKTDTESKLKDFISGLTEGQKEVALNYLQNETWGADND